MTGRAFPWRHVETIGTATLYLGDCFEVLPALGRFDAVVTDPPYGIARRWTGGSRRHGWSKANAELLLRNQWDTEALNSTALNAILDCADQAIIWGGNYFPLPPSRCWLVWNKPERGFSLADAELAWTNRDALVRVIDAPRSELDRRHPTQKPLKVMRWCLDMTTGSVVDPFMGSGTTGVAAVQAGRRFAGIELEASYFELACERIAAAHAEPDFFISATAQPAEQLALVL